MTIALLNFVIRDASDAAARRLTFDRPDPLVAEDLVVWDADPLAGHYAQAEPLAPWTTVLAATGSNRLVRDTRLWAEAFEGLVARGGTLVVFAPREARIGLHTLQEVVDHDFADALRAICPMTTQARSGPASSGSDLRSVTGEPFASFFAAHAADFSLRQHFEASAALTLAVDPAGDCCALYRAVHPGRVLVLPALDDGARADPARAAALVDGVVALVDRLRHHALGSTMRMGADASSPEQRALRDALEAIDAEQRVLAERRTRLRAELDALVVLEQLLVGDRAAAIHAASLVLHRLGAYVQQGVDAGALMFEAGSGIGLLIAIDASDALDDPRALAPDLHEVASGWARPFGGEPVVRYLAIGGATHGDPRVVSGAAFLAAYRDTDAGLLDRLLAR